MARAPLARPPLVSRSRNLRSWSSGLLVAAVLFEIATLVLTIVDGGSAWEAFESRVHVVSITLALLGLATGLGARGANPLWSVLMLLPGFSRFVPSESHDKDPS